METRINAESFKERNGDGAQPAKWRKIRQRESGDGEGYRDTVMFLLLFFNGADGSEARIRCFVLWHS